jgi:acyl-CoA synthetase (AMP-forming)/AMP-acid ligase II
MDPTLGLAPLTPMAQLDRSADYSPERTAYRFAGATTTYAEMREGTRRMAAHLRDRGVRPGDRVATLARNVPLSLLAHFAVPYAGATLVAFDHRLHPAAEHTQVPTKSLHIPFPRAWPTTATGDGNMTAP